MRRAVAVVGLAAGVAAVLRLRQSRGGPPPAEPGDLTRDELYKQAKALGIRGRSSMSKDELRAAVNAHGASAVSP